MKTITIGVLINSLFNAYEIQIWQDIVKIARDKNINLLSFALKKFQTEGGNDSLDPIYKMINPAHLDGIISFSTTLSSFINPEALRVFYESLAPLPIVSIGIEIEGYPSVTIDNNTGMKEIIIHLIEKHGFKNLAYIKGSPGNPESETRFGVYKDILAQYQIPYREELVVAGNFLKEAGSKAVAILLDERGVRFDALISANDAMALYAMRELQERGYKVPEDIAVTGFDDIEESRCGILPLTTVRQPVYEMARSSVELLLTQLGKRDAPEKITLPALMKIRRSCGCFLHTEMEPGMPLPEEAAEESGSETSDDPKLASIVKQVKKYFRRIRLDEEITLWMEKLVSSLSLTLAEPRNSKSFFLILENTILGSIEVGIDVLEWYSIISLLFEVYKKNVKFKKEKNMLEGLWKQALGLIANIADYRYTHANIDYREMNENLHIIGEALKNIGALENMADTVINALQQLGVGRFFLSKYTPREGSPESAKLVFGYDEHGKTHDTNKAYALSDILPVQIRKKYKQAAFLIFPLQVNDIPFGFAVYHIGNLDGSLLESINLHLGNSLQGANRLSHARQQTLELETKAQLQHLVLETTNQKVIAAQAETERTQELLKTREQELTELKLQLELRSMHDHLTNLYNREALFEILKREINRTQRTGWILNRIFRIPGMPAFDPSMNLRDHFGFFSIILLDIDDFKKINEQHGPKIGDKILIKISQVLKREDLFRKEDVPGRFSDEEFVVILPNTNEMNAFCAAERLSQAISKLTFENNISITVSIGIAEFSPSMGDNYAVIRNAESALEHAKKHGKNQIVLSRKISKGDN